MDMNLIDGALTVDTAVGIVGYIRCHSDPNQIPGDTDWSCAVEVIGSRYEIKIYSGKRSATKSEIKRLVQHFESLGLAGSWSRYHNGKKPKTVKI